MTDEEAYWTSRIARKKKLRMRYKGRYWDEIARTREKLELLEQIVKEKLDAECNPKSCVSG